MGCLAEQLMLLSNSCCMLCSFCVMLNVCHSLCVVRNVPVLEGACKQVKQIDTPLHMQLVTRLIQV
jgi:hypothetical protein